jgi:CRISPR-associated protein Cas2
MEVGGDMLVLITYDVQTSSIGGPQRLRKVAKACQNYGQRVQYSVFECIVDAGQLAALKIELRSLIDEEKDSLRFYRLGNKYKTKVEHFGAKPSLDLDGPIIF